MDNKQLSFVFPDERGLIAEPSAILEMAGRTVVFDCETTGLEWWRDKIIGIGLYCPEIDKGVYIPALDSMDRLLVETHLREIADDPHTTLIAHNIKFDAHFLKLPLRDIACTYWDTMVMAHLWDSRLKKGLAALEQTFFGGDSKAKFKPAGGKIHLMRLADVAQYCVNDCELTWQLYEMFTPCLDSVGLSDLLVEDMKYTGVLQLIEKNGMRLDIPRIEKSIEVFSNNLNLMEKELYSKTGRTFNWKSNAELSAALYEGMGIEKPVNPYEDEHGVDRSTIRGAGHYNKHMTSSFILLEKAKHPLGLLINDMRETDKLRLAIQSWLKLADDNNIIHSNFMQTGTRTGRLSSRSPNLQNIASDVRVRETQSVYSGGAIRQDEYNLRLGLIPHRGDNTLLAMDYKQQEMRLFAIIAGEENMMEALYNKTDIHSEVATRVWGEATPVYREWSKTIGFGLIYAMTAGALEHRLDMSREEAQEITQQYWNAYPRVKPYLQETVESCKENGYLRYWSGRIWREPDEGKMYKGANALVQGGSSDLLKTAVIRCQDWVDKSGLREQIQLVNLVHDEIVFETLETKAIDFRKELANIMELEDLFDIPFVTDAKIGKTFGSMDKL
jgi:DNA polymerase-1